MIPAIFINCKEFPFVDLILRLEKLCETRTRNTLGRFLGERVLLVETGHGKPMVKGSAVIESIHECFTREAWETCRASACIEAGCSYDWQPDTKKKVLYYLTDVKPCDPFPLPDSCRRHGRVWAEYEEEAVIMDKLTKVTYIPTGGGVYCYSALYKGKYWVFGSTDDVMSAYTIDPLNTFDDEGDWVDENEYRIDDADDFPTWREVLDSIPPEVVGLNTYALEQARLDIHPYQYDLPVTEYGEEPDDE